ncbi:MAG: OsmC family protein [Geminicoccaceae bacterium]|nr:OsmC family protein [Geminicoccaceae bacterium]
MQGRVKWVEGRSFVATSQSGHSLVIDGPKEAGGENLGPSPMEFVLLGAGGCSAFDVIEILRKSRQDVTDCEVKLEAERAAEPPRVFTTLHLHFIVTGNRLKETVVERAVQLSAEKYCSATAMLGKTATVTHTFEVVAV